MITLEFNLKVGKNAMKVTVSEQDAPAAERTYSELLAILQPETPPTKPAEQAAVASTGATKVRRAAPTPPPPAQKSAPAETRGFSKNAIALNEAVIRLAGRMAVCVPQFNGRSAQEIITQLNYHKPIAMMSVEELTGLQKLIRDTLTQYSASNPAVAAYLKVTSVIDGLMEGSEEEWSAVRDDIKPEDWASFDIGAGWKLKEAAKAYLLERQAELRAISAAVEFAGVA